MTALAARAGDTIAIAQARARRLTQAASTGSIWLLIAALFVWAALAQTQQFAVGIIVASVLALGAIGLTLIYGILRFANFAHGDMMTLGAYVAFAAYVSGPTMGPLSFGYGMIVALVAAAAALSAFALLSDRLVFRPLRRRGSGVAILAIASLGLALIARATVLLAWGPQPRVYERGTQIARPIAFDVRLRDDQIFIIIAAVALIAAVTLLLYRTKLGKAMRAMADNRELAEITGINTDRVIVWTWLISGSLVAVAGVLLGIQAQVTPLMGFSLLIPMFAATILGGIGSPHGALLGALVVGISQEASTGVDLPYPPGWGPGYKPAIAFLVLIVMLILRPRGLFGVRD